MHLKAGRRGTHSLVSIGCGGKAVPYSCHKLSHGVLQGEDHGIGARIKCIRHLEPKCVSSRSPGTLSSDPLPAREPRVSQSCTGPKHSNQGMVSTKYPGVSHLCLEPRNRLLGCKLGKTQKHRTNQNCRWSLSVCAVSLSMLCQHGLEAPSWRPPTPSSQPLSVRVYHGPRCLPTLLALIDPRSLQPALCWPAPPTTP